MIEDEPTDAGRDTIPGGPRVAVFGGSTRDRYLVRNRLCMWPERLAHVRVSYRR